MLHCLKQCFFKWDSCINLSQNHVGCPQTDRTKVLGNEAWKSNFFNKHHPIPQEILEHAENKACQPEAVILNLGCAL